MDRLKKTIKKPSFPISPNSKALLVWRLFHALFVHATVLAVVYQACVDATANGFSYAVIYIGDVVHILNTLLLFLTACNNRGRIVMDRHVIFKENFDRYFVIDVISLLPLEIFAFASSSALFTAALLRLNRVLRFGRVLQLSNKLQKNVRINALLSNIAAIISFTVFILNISCCVWFVFSCDNVIKGGQCEKQTWAEHVFGTGGLVGYNHNDTHLVEDGSGPLYYAISLYYTMQTIFTIGYGDIVARNARERVFAIVMMLFTFIFYGLMLGKLANILAAYNFRRQHFKQRFAVIRQYLKRACIKEDLQEKVIQFYEFEWEQTYGNSVSGIMNSFPTTIRQEMVRNLYSDMFAKVPFLKDAPESFLKEVSLNTEKLILLPDQVLLKKGEEQHSMYFISNGTLEVHGGKKVHTFTEGQCLGEISLIYSVCSTALVKSVTNCELFVLSRASLKKAFYFHPDVADQLKIQVQDRKVAAFRQFNAPVEENVQNISNSASQVSTDNVMDNTKTAQESSSHKVNKLRKLITFLAEWIILPNSKFRIVWNIVMLMSIYIVLNLYIFEAAFKGYYRQNSFGTTNAAHLRLFTYYCLDFLFVVDIFISMKMADYVHMHSGHNLTKEEVRRKYIRSATFYLDVLAVIPLEILAPLFANPWRSVSVLRLNRLLKQCKFVSITNSMNKNLYYSEGKILAIKLCGLVTFTLTLFANYWFAVSCGFHGELRCADNSWLYSQEGIVNSTDSLSGYTSSLYFGAATMTQTGYGDIHPHTIPEHVFNILPMCIGFLTWNICVVMVTAILLNYSYSKKLFREIMSALVKYVCFHMEDKAVVKEIEHHFDLLWNEYRGERYSTSELLHELPEILKDEVIFNELGEIVQNVPFFEGTETSFLKKLLKIVVTNLHCPGDFIFCAGDLGEELYLVKKGFVEILSEDLSHVVNRLGIGGYFGEFGMLNGSPYNVTVRCATYCEVLSIARSDLDKLLESYPLLQNELKQWEIASEAMEDLKPNTIDESAPYSSTNYGIHNALAVTMVLPLSLVIPKQLISNVAGYWRSDLLKKIACPISCCVGPETTFVHYKKELDDPYKTAEVHHQRNSVRNLDMPFKLSQKGRIMSQASGLFERKRWYGVDPQSTSDIELDEERSWCSKCQEKLDQLLSFILMPYVLIPKSTFSFYWEIFITILCYVSTYTLPLQASFYDQSITLWIINYLIDIVMLANIFLRIHTAYYNDEGVLITNPLMCAKHYFKTNFIFDVIANLLPTDIFALGSRDQKLATLAFVRLNRLFRVYQVVTGIGYLETWIFIPVVIARAIMFFATLIMCTHWIACFWIMISCPNSAGHHCKSGSWATMETAFTPIDNSTLSEKYAIALYWAVVSTTQVGYGDIVAYTIAEQWFAVVVMVLGSVGYSYSISTVASSFGHTAYGKMSFQDRLHNMEFYLKEKNSGKSAIDRVMNYYSLLWKRIGALNLSELMKGLPLSLRTEISFCVYKDIIAKVSLFQDAEISFIKLISRYCKPVFIPKDEFIIKKGDSSPSMYFITMGTVDVVSEDGEIIFDTLNEGDFFGEMSCLCGAPSLTSFRASTNCDLFTLDKPDYDICLKFHQDLSTKMFQFATTRYRILQKHVRSSIAMNSQSRRNTPSSARRSDVEVKDIELGILYNSTQPSTTVKSNVKRLIKKYLWFYTISYKSKFVKILTAVSLLLNATLSFVIPYETLYNERHDAFMVLHFVSEIFYISEIYFKFHITFENVKGVEVTDQKQIARHYLKSKTGFIVDLIAVIPLEFLSYAISDDFLQTRVYLLLHLIHLIRTFRVIIILHPDNWKIPKWFQTIGIFVLCFFFTIFVLHLITSLSFFIRYGDYDSWEYAIGNLTIHPHLLYLRNMYLMTATMTTTGYGDITVTYIPEALFICAILITSKLVYSFVVGYYSKILSLNEVQQVKAKQDFRGLKMFMAENGLHGVMQQNILNYIVYTWERNHGYHLQTLFIDLPFSLKKEVRLISTLSAFENVQFLANVGVNILSELSLLLKSQYFIPGQYIVQQKDLVQCMYFVSNGKAEVYDYDGNGSTRILQTGDCFCEETLFNNEPARYSVKSIEYVDVFVLHKRDLDEMLTIHPEAVQVISQCMGQTWGMSYLHRSKIRQLSTIHPPLFAVPYDEVL